METDAHTDDDLEVVATFVRASRVLVAIAVESVEKRSDVSLSQFRVLVLLANQGSQKVVTLADAMQVNPSTATRLCDQLVRRDLVRRARSSRDRREVIIEVTPTGLDLVRDVLAHRRERIGHVLEQIPATDRKVVVPVLDAFADAAGDVAEQAWSVGW